MINPVSKTFIFHYSIIPGINLKSSHTIRSRHSYFTTSSFSRKSKIIIHIFWRHVHVFHPVKFIQPELKIQVMKSVYSTLFFVVVQCCLNSFFSHFFVRLTLIYFKLRSTHSLIYMGNIRTQRCNCNIFLLLTINLQEFFGGRI